MYFIHQDCELLSATHNGLDLIERGYRICYQSENKNNTSQEQFIKSKIQIGHETPLEHAHLTFLFNTCRSVTHEFVRHRLISPNQESSRYCKYKNGLMFIIPIWGYGYIEEGEYNGSNLVGDPVLTKMHDEYRQGFDEVYFKYPNINWIKTTKLFLEKQQVVENGYLELLDCGLPAEFARELHSNMLKTQIMVTANVREWRHIFSLRVFGSSGVPHIQIRKLLEPALYMAQKAIPYVFDDVVGEVQAKYYS